MTPDCAAPSLRIADLLCHATKRLRIAGASSGADIGLDFGNGATLPAITLGATRWEATKVTLHYARTGIFGAVMLGFGRALGETMAVTMVIGNNPKVTASIFAPQYTMAAVIANEFTEAVEQLHLDALVEIGLVLFVITMIVNLGSRFMVWRMSRS